MGKALIIYVKVTSIAPENRHCQCIMSFMMYDYTVYNYGRMEGQNDLYVESTVNGVPCCVTNNVSDMVV